jgi:hypothetical protein
MQVLITALRPLSPQVHGPRLLRYSRDDQRDNTIYTTLPPPSQHNPFTVAVSMALDYADGFGCGCDGEPAFFELRAPPWAPPQSNVTNTTAALHVTEGAVVGAPGSPRCIARPSNQMHASAHHGALHPVPTGASHAHPIRQT